jgi:hypothetical protein
LAAPHGTNPDGGLSDEEGQGQPDGSGDSPGDAARQRIASHGSDDQTHEKHSGLPSISDEVLDDVIVIFDFEHLDAESTPNIDRNPQR